MRFTGGMIAALLIALADPAAAGDTLSIKAFYGTYSGAGVAKNADSIYFAVTERDFDVVIHPEASGFSVALPTVLHTGRDPARPKIKRRADKLAFVPSGRAGVWRGTETADPLGGAPYAWARIEGNSLIVYVLQIDQDGRYEVQRYERTLIGSDMELTFTDTRDGERARTVKGKLIKTAE